MELIDVVVKTQQKNLKFYFGFRSKQKSLEIVVIFKTPKGFFNLDGTVHAVLGFRFAYDVFVGNLSLADKVFGYIQPFVSLGFGTFVFVWSNAGFLPLAE